ncbi:autotransporter strand-loop-strand O-heptosyltransferase [Gluconobacter sp. Dm-62]|nr:autotransporter strand-loop-strand O-heptosyltransferase [Gluconobacter sp. Dm-62]MBS1103321.1 autotransporter strand-loop-strand O-heptosyltransferase [Gluconobacter sp. Dm-62]
MGDLLQVSESSRPAKVMEVDASSKVTESLPVKATDEKREGEAPEKNPFLNPVPLPVLQGPASIRFDFNQGARVVLPARETGQWHAVLRDLDTGNILFTSTNAGAQIASAKRYYVRFGIEIDETDAQGVRRQILRHELDLRDRPVIVEIPVGTLGDTLGWFPYVARFAKLRNARVTCVMSGLIIPLLQDAYPELTLVTKAEAEEQKLVDTSYASYRLGLFFDDKDHTQQPTDFRFVGLHRTAGYILGIDPAEEPPRLAVEDSGRPIEEPYVCIAAQASSQCKYWNNPAGWWEIVNFLKQEGYRVVCIDQKPVHGTGIVWNHIPFGAEDQTGDRPLAERVRWLKHAAFFIGGSSGLAWLAWAAGTKVVMISGFTHPTNEFHTPYRIINWHSCNSCWNDPAHQFDHKDFLWCPRHAGTARQFECTRLITPAHVKAVIATIPGPVSSSVAEIRGTEMQNAPIT